jgi:ATP-dependent DNA helicase 2 subunit 2
LLDALIVASNHFHEDINKRKSFKEKRIIVLTDYSSHTDDDDRISMISSSLAKHSIRIDSISPFSDETEDDSVNDLNTNNKKPDSQSEISKSATASASDSNRSNGYNGNTESKPMTSTQRKNQTLLKQIIEKTDGGLYSFDEALKLLSMYQSKTTKSTGTKFTMTIGDGFKLPIVSMIKCKENKPELFRFKKVYAKDEMVELKTDKARFTKDDEQRDLDDKTDVVDAFRYGSSFVPIDNSDSLALKAEKCFSMLGFTKSANVRNYYFMGDTVHQIMPDPAGGESVESAFVDMVHSMYEEDVYGIVRKVYSARSSPELGCLIPYISADTVCLFYITMPFEDDVRKFTLENFSLIKKYKPTEKQMDLIDQLIDSMDLTKKKNHSASDSEEQENEEEPYDPHLTFNPYIQRMFQSIAIKATSSKSELPDFEKHITKTHLLKIGECIKNENTNNLLKRCAQEFPVKVEMKKQKAKDEPNNLFDDNKKKANENQNMNGAREDELNGDKNFNLNDILKSNSNIKKIGTITPVEDYKALVNKLDSSLATFGNEFEQLSSQICSLIKEFIGEFILQSSMSSTKSSDHVDEDTFQSKAVDCIKALREICVSYNRPYFINNFLHEFKEYLKSHKLKSQMSCIESFWKRYFMDEKLSLVSKNECSSSDLTEQEANEYLNEIYLNEDKAPTQFNTKQDENVEDLLDLM